MKFFISFVILVLSLNSYALEFKDASNDIQRQAPQKDILLSFNESIKDARKAVVNISTTKTVETNYSSMPFFNDPFFEQFFGQKFKGQTPQKREQSSLGSGVIVSSDGYIITNNHVVNGADKIKVTIPNSDNQEYDAKLIGTDEKSDIAVIKIEVKDLPFIEFADSSKAKVGDVVFAIGNPFGVGETVTSGIISALNKTGVGIAAYENFIQTDASINPGNSGGALVDSRGALIGINTAIISRSGGNVGIGFAIPSNMAKTIATSLVKDGKVMRGYLGVSIGDVTGDLKEFYNNKKGAMVINVEDDTPAKKAGIKRGDLIVSVEDKVIKNANDLRNTVGFMAPRSKVKVVVIRDKKEKTLLVTLGSLKSAVEISNEGFNALEGLTLSEENSSIVITKVKENSKASQKGFKAGDIILQIEDIKIDSIATLKKALKLYEGAKRVWVQRGNSIYVTVM